MKTENSFVNSFKMKFSIIFGVIHMTLGVLLKGINSLFDFNLSKLFFIVLPELAFLLCSFGYMVYCIIFKWLSHYPDPSKAPSIISLFINFPFP
jgi:V-type H+-transporting ATPase subunit a